MSDHLIAEANRHAEALPKMTLPTTKPNDLDLAWYRRECELLQDRNEVLEVENARLQMELDASYNAEELRQARAENAALRELLHRSLFWLDDYDSRQFSGSAKIADDIKEVLQKEAQQHFNRTR